MLIPVPNYSLSAYLRQQNQLHPYKVRPRLELIMKKAAQLAEQNGDHLNAVYIAWAMLHVKGSIAQSLLIAHGLTEAHVQALCQTPSFHQMELGRFYERIVEIVKAKKSKLMGTEHLLMALLTDSLLCAQFRAWGINVSALQEETRKLART